MERPGRAPAPTGITATPDGRVFFASLAGSHIAEIRRATGREAASIRRPKARGHAGSGPTAVADIWVSEWNSGQLSRYTPASGEWRVWKLPGERPRAYAVYVDERDIVWLSDFGANATSASIRRPNFTSWPGSGPNANVRQILGRKGEVFLPDRTDRIMVIRTGKAPRDG